MMRQFEPQAHAVLGRFRRQSQTGLNEVEVEVEVEEEEEVEEEQE